MSLPVEITNAATSRQIHSNYRDRGQPLTERQLECLSWTQEGKSASDIGMILGISGRTVEGHLAKVCQQLGVRTRIQAVIKAKDLGFLRPPKG